MFLCVLGVIKESLISMALSKKSIGMSAFCLTMNWHKSVDGN